jgi:threonine 3-dehydrogenase
MTQKMMDAIVKPVAGVGLELRQVPVPVPGPGEVLIKVHKTAICGTDVHIYDWTPWSAEHVKPPMVIGHEYVGEIAELGALKPMRRHSEMRAIPPLERRMSANSLEKVLSQ